MRQEHLLFEQHSPSARRKRETGQEIAPKRAPEKDDPESVIGSSEEIV
jgi:hypothetical protein